MNLLQIAMGEIGVQGIPGIGDNPQILKYAEEADFPEYNSDETAWCSLFMNWVAEKAKMVRSKNLLARSWLNVGTPIQSPEPGDIVIFWRGSPDSWKGHVGIFMGFSVDNSRIYSLGGNQGNQVSITGFRTSELLGFRRLYPKGKIEFLDLDLRLKDTGSAVVTLQDALKQLGYNVGTSDGIFGPKTERAIKDFQLTDDTMEMNGIFDKKTRDFMNRLVNP